MGFAVWPDGVPAPLPFAIQAEGPLAGHSPEQLAAINLLLDPVNRVDHRHVTIVLSGGIQNAWQSAVFGFADPIVPATRRTKTGP